MKIGDLVTFKIDYDSECIHASDTGIVIKIERDPYPTGGAFGQKVATIAWPWGPERHRTSGLHVLSKNGEQR
tara:strand:- start:297 stop:512 length:216 start_codon:yes stop_codon:yes gene_type:complete